MIPQRRLTHKGARLRGDHHVLHLMLLKGREHVPVPIEHLWPCRGWDCFRAAIRSTHRKPAFARRPTATETNEPWLPETHPVDHERLQKSLWSLSRRHLR